RLVQLLRQGERFCPRSLRKRRVEVLVGLTLDHQHAQPESAVRLDKDMVEVFAQTLGDLWNWQGGKLAPKAADLCVEGIALIASCEESLARLGKERLSTRPDTEPRKSVGFGEQLVRVGD